MENNTVIRDLSYALGDLLKEHIPDVEVTYDSPANAGRSRDTRILIYPIHILANPFMVNDPPVQLGSENTVVIRSLEYSIQYLFAVYGNPETELILLNNIIIILAQYPQVLTRITVSPEESPVEEVCRILPLKTSTDEIYRIWALFPGVPYQNSLFYELKPVRIPLSPSEGGTRVKTVDIDYNIMPDSS